MAELREYVQDDQRPELLKGPCRRVDAGTRQAFFRAPLMPDFDAPGIRNPATDEDAAVNLKRLARPSCGMAWVRPRQKLPGTIRKDCAPGYGGAEVAGVLRFPADHQHCPDVTRGCARHAPAGIGR